MFPLQYCGELLSKVSKAYGLVPSCLYQDPTFGGTSETTHVARPFSMTAHYGTWFIISMINLQLISDQPQ